MIFIIMHACEREYEYEYEYENKCERELVSRSEDLGKPKQIEWAMLSVDDDGNDYGMEGKWAKLCK